MFLLSAFPPLHRNLCCVRPVLATAALFSLLALTTQGENQGLPPVQTAPKAQFYSLPMHFEANAGQTDAAVDFLSRGPGYTVFLTPSQAVLTLQSGSEPKTSSKAGPREQAQKGRRQSSLSMTLVGANVTSAVEGQDKLEGTVNYFVGNNPDHWHSSIPLFAKVKYTGVYPGIDLVYYGQQQQLEYDFVVAPGANSKQIHIRFSGADGLEIDPQAGLVVRVGSDKVRWQKPFAYQDTDAGRTEVAVRFVLDSKNQVSFQVGNYDRSRPLIIDPVLAYATYFGGSGDDFLLGIAADGSGNVYVVGDTLSANYPTSVGAFRTTKVGSNDVVVTKLNATGSAIVFSTYLGGNAADFAGGIAIDSSRNVYVTGVTESQNFPTRNAPFGANAGFFDAFLSKLGPFGTNLLYSTYLGGGSDDSGNGIAVDNSGNAYITGDSFSLGTGNSPFPTTQGAYQGNNSGRRDAFVAKFNTTLSGAASVGYITFLGGNTDEKGEGIAIDGSGNAIVVGGVVDNVSVYPDPFTSDFPTLNALQSSFNRGATDPDTSGSGDAFVSKLNAAGSGLLFSTFLGGSSDDTATAVTVDSAGRFYIMGETTSKDFPIVNGAQTIIGGGLENDFPAHDAFIAKFQSNGTSIAYSTYLGGSGFESGFSQYHAGIAVDRSGYIYVAGYTDSLDDFPLTTGADQTNSFGQSDAFVAKLNPAISGPSSLIYASFLGGDDDDRATGCAVDTNGLLYVTGFTSSTTNFPSTPGVVRPNSSGGYDGWIAKLTSPADISVSLVAGANPIIIGSNMTFTLQVNNNSSFVFSGVSNIVQIATNFALGTITTSQGNFSVNGNQIKFNIGTLSNNVSVNQTIAVTSTSPGDTTNTASLSSIETPILEPNTGNNLATVLESIRGIADVTLTQTAPSQVVLSSNIVYTIAITNKGFWAASALNFSNMLPDSLAFVSATVSPTNQGTCFRDGQLVTCDLGTLQKGSGAIITLVTLPIATGTIINASTVTQFELDPTLANNSDSSSTIVSPLADLQIAQTASTNQVFAGNNLTYTVFVTNRGPSATTGVVISDPLPAGVSLVSTTPSAGGSVSNNAGTVFGVWATQASNEVVSLAITVRPTVAGIITNTTSVSSTVPDPVAGNNTAALNTTVVAAADLGLSQNAAPSTLMVASNVTFTIVLTNRGPSAASSVVFSDPLPAAFAFVSAQSSQGTCSYANGVVTCSLPSLASGSSVTITIVGRAVLDGISANIASVTSSSADLSLPNNSASASVTVNENPAAPVLRIALSGTNVVLSWSTNADTFRLQVAAGISASPAWFDATNVPVVVGKQFMVTNAVRTGNFYRLVQTPTSLSAMFIAPNRVVVSWPTLAPGGILKRANSLLPNTSWTPVAITPVIIGNRYYVTNPVSGNAFFRLYY
jgi:uncharacterized repeat protein (TIGR01451 family)